jgi:hypothetical protein
MAAIYQLSHLARVPRSIRLRIHFDLQQGEHLDSIAWIIPKSYLYAHMQPCQLVYNSACPLLTNGEAIERVWQEGFGKEEGSLKAEYSSQTRVSGFLRCPRIF